MRKYLEQASHGPFVHASKPYAFQLFKLTRERLPGNALPAEGKTRRHSDMSFTTYVAEAYMAHLHRR